MNVFAVLSGRRLIAAKILLVFDISNPLASGATIFASATDMSAFTATTTYVMSVNPGGNISSASFTGPTTVSNTRSFMLTIAPGDVPPPDATLDSATLDLSRLVTLTDGALSSVMTGTGGTVGTFSPTFSSTPATLFISISAALGGVTTFAAPGISGITGYDLVPLYGNDILAGNPLAITWIQIDTFAGSTAGYTRNNWRSATRTFHLSQQMNAEVQATLNASWTPEVAAVPEPLTLLLMGSGLLVAICGRRRLQSRLEA